MSAIPQPIDPFHSQCNGEILHYVPYCVFRIDHRESFGWSEESQSDEGAEIDQPCWWLEKLEEPPASQSNDGSAIPQIGGATAAQPKNEEPDSVRFPSPRISAIPPILPLMGRPLPAKRPPPQRPPPWYVAFSKGFRDNISKIDRSLQGRILEAIGEILKDPITPRGDTLRSLGGNLAGLWRFRIGDFRLVYHPDRQTGNVTLMAFESRGDIYQ